MENTKKPEQPKQEAKPKKHPLQEELEKQKQSYEELKDTLQRLQAEFDNYRKRAEKDKQQCIRFASAEIIKKLLPLLDTFEIALKNAHQKDDFYKGMEMVYANIISLLQNEGVRPIKSMGEKFDPYKHEVLLSEESDKEDETILEELQKGYMLNDAVLRFAKVKIAKTLRSKGTNEVT